MPSQKFNRLIEEQLLTTEIIQQRAELQRHAKIPSHLYIGREMLKALKKEMHDRRLVEATAESHIFGCLIVVDETDEWLFEVRCEP